VRRPRPPRGRRIRQRRRPGGGLWGKANAELLVGRAEAIRPRSRPGGHQSPARRCIGSFVNIFGNELVVVGGGFGTAAFEFLAPSALEIARRETVEPDALPVKIVKAELGAAAGLIGAGLNAFEALGAG
jgi:hypothetical protein